MSTTLVCDQRTDSYADIGKMYHTPPGFYLLVGPDWTGTPPNGIETVFRCPTWVGCVIPRVFQSDEPADKKTVQPLINQILAYPLSKFDGKPKTKDWTHLPSFPSASQGDEEVTWVVPETFFDVLGSALDEAPPLSGEEAVYAQVRSVLQAAEKDAALKKVLHESAIAANKELVAPLFEFRNYGLPLPNNWTTITNEAAFGADYFTRTAVAKSSIFVNKAHETRYFYQDLDASGAWLNGANRYTVTYPKGQLPPVRGFWSLTLYNEHHFFFPNDLKRYSLGTKNKDLKTGADGSLTIDVQPDPPEESKRSNWMPAPKGNFSLYQRAYWPEQAILDGKWTPPAVARAG